MVQPSPKKQKRGAGHATSRASSLSRRDVLATLNATAAVLERLPRSFDHDRAKLLIHAALDGFARTNNLLDSASTTGGVTSVLSREAGRFSRSPIFRMDDPPGLSLWGRLWQLVNLAYAMKPEEIFSNDWRTIADKGGALLEEISLQIRSWLGDQFTERSKGTDYKHPLSALAGEVKIAIACLESTSSPGMIGVPEQYSNIEWYFEASKFSKLFVDDAVSSLLRESWDLSSRQKVTMGRDLVLAILLQHSAAQGPHVGDLSQKGRELLVCLARLEHERDPQRWMCWDHGELLYRAGRNAKIHQSDGGRGHWGRITLRDIAYALKEMEGKAPSRSPVSAIIGDKDLDQLVEAFPVSSRKA